METKNLLIVDSLEINRSVLFAMLSPRYNVMEAATGEEALELLREHSSAIDIVLLAFELDGMSGIATLRSMADDSYLDSIPVIMLAVDSTVGLMGSAYAYGAVDYICRPYDMQVIHHRISNALALKYLAEGEGVESLQTLIPTEEACKKETALLAAQGSRLYGEITQIRQAFTTQTDEAWFEYRFHPATFIANEKLQQLLDAPMVVSDPANNELTSEAIAQLLRHVMAHFRQLEPGDSYFELVIPGEFLDNDHRCLVKGSVLSTQEEDRVVPSGILGRVIDIEDMVSALELAAQKTSTLATMTLQDHIDEIGDLGDVKLMMGTLGNVFDIVRLVDPVICSQINLGDDKLCVDRHSHCFDVWGKSERCIDCISSRVSKECPRINKFENIGNDIYYIISNYVELAGRSYALECVSKVDDNASGLAEAANERHLVSLANYNRQLYQDPVSGARSRNYWNDRASGLVGHYAVAVVDIDNFKIINDRLGHLWGDKALRLLVQAMDSKIRAVDKVIRYGGDEFVIVLVEMDEQAMEEKLSSILEAVGRVTVGDNEEISLQVSIGAVCDTGKIGDMFKRADKALLKAKETKGCFVVGK